MIKLVKLLLFAQGRRRMLRLLKALAASMLLSSLALAANPKTVRGAAVSGARLDNGTVRVSILNLSQHGITGWTLAITQRLSNGQASYEEHTEDYGPPEDTHKGVHSGDAIEYTEPAQDGAQTVDAQLVVVFYDDQTAEVKNERSFEDTMKVRRANAIALQQTAEAFKNAAADASPRERAAHDFDELQRNADTNKADRGFLSSYAGVAASAPRGQERDFMQRQAKQLQRMADNSTRHATIRRLP
jgi:hypothetical protein